MDTINKPNKIETRGRKAIPLTDELIKARKMNKKKTEKLYKDKYLTKNCIHCDLLFKSIKFLRCKPCRILCIKEQDDKILNNRL